MLNFKTANGNDATLSVINGLDVQCEVLGQTFMVVKRAYGFDSRDPLLSVKVVVDRNWLGDVHQMIDAQAKLHPLLRAALYGELSCEVA